MAEKHHSEGKNVRRTLHTMRKRQYILEYCSQQACGSKRKSDIAEVISSKTVNTRSLSLLQPRALSLQNLVSGYECGRVFPAGVGPGSPSRDAANRLLSRFGLSVETRRQYGLLRRVFPGLRLFRAPIWWPLGGWRHARGREHCHGEPVVVLYQVGTHQIRRRRRAARSLTSQGRAKPLCAKVESANQEVFEGKADL